MTNDWFYSGAIKRATREFNYCKNRAMSEPEWQWRASYWKEHLEYLENLVTTEERNDSNSTKTT